ncbi:MSHA biogenesis protein MshP [Pseudoduganella sp. LjRoot289]|uniref:MSHA biogenesis protein MshP n=1 Tax=Pseudoduganella sp. LjRoot289 TaxID=3342314 RepID=UPI003ECD2F44
MINHRPQTGFAYIAAILILVALSTLGITVTRLSTTQQTTTAQDAGLAFALQTARAGTEWGLHRALVNSSCVGGTGTTLDFRATNGFSVTVTCWPFSFDEGESAPGVPLSKTAYTLSAVACNSSVCPDDSKASQPDYVERRRTVTACGLAPVSGVKRPPCSVESAE